MARQFIVKSLRTESVDKAFAVVRSADFSLTLDQWRDYALGLIKNDTTTSGILTLENRAGIIQGLCCYHTESSPGRATICSVGYMVVLDLIDEASVTAVLLTVLEDMARRQGIAALRIDLPHGARTTELLLQRLCKTGYQIERIRLLKELHAAEESSRLVPG